MVLPLINISRKQALIFAAFLVMYEFLTYIANDMVMPGMIRVVEALHGPESAVANSLTAYVLGGASLQLFLGPISDRFGRRPVMLFGAVFFFICTLIIACSQTMDQFIIARFFQGMGLCFIGVVGYATLQEMFAEVDAIRLVAIMANVSILAPLVGPLLGAFVIHYWGWRVIFWGISGFTVIAFIGLCRYMPEPIGQTKRDGQKIEPTKLDIRTVLHNYKRLITNQSFLLGSFAFGMIGVPCLTWIALSPIILVKNAHLSVVQYGLWQIPIFGASILGNWFLQGLTRYYATKRILGIGTAVIVFGLLLTGLFPLMTNGNYIWLMPGLIIYFMGLGIANAPLDRLILFSTPVAKGTASALMTLTCMLVLALGIEGGNLVYTKNNNQAFGLYCLACALVFLGLVLGAFLGRKVSATDPSQA